MPTSVENFDTTPLACHTVVLMRSTLPLVALSVAVALVLSGCVPQEPEVLPPPEQSTEPLFASDEEALAAATDAYEAYLKMSDLIGHEGGDNAERLEAFATRDALSASLQEFDMFTEKRLRSTGSTRFSNIKLQQVWSASPDGTDVVSAYVCLDVSSVDVVDSNGVSIVAAARHDHQLMEVSFDSGQDDGLLVSNVEPWPDGSSC